MDIPLVGKENPTQFKFSQPAKFPQPKPQSDKPPETLNLLTQAMSQLDTEELRFFIGALIAIDKQREGRSDHISLSPEPDQAQDPHMGGKVGVTGGWGVPQHDPDEGRFDLGNPNNPYINPK